MLELLIILLVFVLFLIIIHLIVSHFGLPTPLATVIYIAALLILLVYLLGRVSTGLQL